jgi:hypothetical protein
VKKRFQSLPFKCNLQRYTEDVRVLLAPGLTSMYCLTQKPAKPPTLRPLYQAPGGPTFRRWMYAWWGAARWNQVDT